MTIYSKTRRKYGLTPRQMAKYCDLPLSVYYKIEKGIELEGSEKMFDKFIRNIAIKKVEEMNEEEAVNLKLETINDESKMDEFFESFDRKTYFKKFNIKSYGQLAELLNNKYKPDLMMMYISKIKAGQSAPQGFKEDIYDFFSDTKNVQPENAVQHVKIKTTRGKAKLSRKQMTDDQKWYMDNLEGKLKKVLADEYGDGEYYGSLAIFEERHGIKRAEVSRLVHGAFPQPGMATRIRSIFEKSMQTIEPEKTIEPIIEPIVEPTVEPKEVEKVINVIDEKVTYLAKENEILRDIIRQLPSDVLLGLIISSRMGE